MQTRVGFRLGIGLCALWLAAGLGRAAVGYNFQQYEGNGLAGSVGNATLQLSNNTTTVKANFIKGIGSFVDNLVIFVDTTPGGFTSTASLSDRGSGLESAISGYSVSRSVATFAPGFEADYAIALGVNSGSAVYKLVNDASGPHLELVRSGLNFLYTDSPNHATYSFQFDWADIGLPSGNTNFFKFETTYITSTASRSLQSFEGMTGTAGFGNVTFTNYDTYGVPPVPENTNLALAVVGGVVLSLGMGKKVRVWLSPSRHAAAEALKRCFPP